MSVTRETGDNSLSSTVAEYAQKCFESFQHCLDSASKSNKLTAPRSRPSLVRIEDQLARFQLWITSLRVFSAGRDSLDYRLRDVPDVQTPVIGLLQALDFRVKTCSRVLDSMLLSPERTLIEETVEKFLVTVDGVSSEITLLHKITNTIRRVSKDTQNSRAAEGFKIRDDEGNDAGPFLQEIFTNYIHDRFPGVSEEIRKRLALSMVLRRKRLLYRRERYGKKPVQLPRTISAPLISRPEPDIITPLHDVDRPAKRRILAAPTQSVVHSTATATTLTPERFRKSATPSVVSIPKTVKLSDNDDVVFPPAPTRALMQRYTETRRDIEIRHKQRLLKIRGYREGVNMASLASGSTQELINAELERASELAKAWDDCIEAVGEVTCPYCFHMLPVREVIDELKWKYHIKNDLEPYVCLFESCQTPGHLYAQSDTWIKHMMKHALRWRCASRRHAEFVTDSRQHYLDHMKRSHSDVLTDAQIGVLADQNGRANGPLFKACPLCGEEKENSSLIGHLVDHMRSLAIKSLPPHYEDTDDFDLNNVEQHSWGSSLPQSRSTIKNASAVNLDFIDTLGLGQLSEDPSIPNIMEITSVPGPGFDQSLLTEFPDASQLFTMLGSLIPQTPVTQQSLVKPQVQRFACPFYKRDPELHETSRACSGPGWETVHRVKEHIFRRHTLPEHECNRCFEVFETELKLSHHMRKAAPCKVASHRSQEHEGINSAQSQQLRARMRIAEPGSDLRMVEEERWNGVYSILFPDDESIPTPYYDR